MIGNIGGPWNMSLWKKSLSLFIVACVVTTILLVHGNAFNGLLLRFSASQGFAELTEVFVFLGADIHANDDQALQLAAQNGHTKVVETLIDNGANIHAQKDVSLYLAAINGHTKTALMLLDHGSRPMLCNEVDALVQGADKANSSDALRMRATLKDSMTNCGFKFSYPDLSEIVK